MKIPSAEELSLPVLEVTSDGEDHRFGEVVMKLAERYELSEDERRTRLQRTGQSRFANRVGWAVFNLKKAGLVESAGYGKLRVSKSGLEVLSRGVKLIDRKFLLTYPRYKEFLSRKKGAADEDNRKNQSPEENLETSYQELLDVLAADILERIEAASPRFFEGLVVDLLCAMEYGGSGNDAGIRLGQVGDEGVDGVIKEDRLGFDSIYVQAKKWSSTVGRPHVQAFVGSLEGKKARKGVMITTSDFSQTARDYVSKIQKKVVLVNGIELANLMIEYGVGVTDITNYIVKKVDSDYFKESP